MADQISQPDRETTENVSAADRHARFHLAAIIESADDAIISKDLQGVVTSWNHAACRIFGYTAEEMIGCPILRIIPDRLQGEEAEILNRLRAGGRIDHYETIRVKKNGDVLNVSVTISPIKDGSGQVIGISKILRDISDRKRIERVMIQSEKLAATGRMAATIAHEINNPLESVMNLIYLALRASPAGSKASEYLATAENEVKRVSQIAQRTLGYYRDTGAVAPVRLHVLIETVLAVYASQLQRAAISMDSHFEDEQPIVANSGELIQVFSNILTNAVDAMSCGGVLHLSTRRASYPSGDGIETMIRDEGCGIDQKHLASIFEPFFTTKGERGTGIGLWVARQLVEKRGGEIAITSNTEAGNSGTSVIIFLPFAIPGEDVVRRHIPVPAGEKA